MNIDNNYIVKLRREIHMYPEVDFDLPKTIAVVERELEAMGVPYTEKYGKGSVVGYINPDKEGFTIGIRADMDALRMTEANECEYRSRHDGMMHACGHDAHTAILIAAAKELKEMEKDLACRVKLIFQPSEEGVDSGAMMMIENGVLDDVDIMLGLHVWMDDIGKLGWCSGVFSASSRHFKIEIGGKSCHVTEYDKGIDALAIAIKMYHGIHDILANEVDPKEQVICRVTKLNSGTAQNIIPNSAFMQGTIRTLNVSVSKFIHDRIQKLAQCLSEMYGVEIKVYDASLKSTCVYNNPYLADLMKKSMQKVVGPENVENITYSLGSEDFSRFTDIVPSVFFRLGVRNIEKGIDPVFHQVDFEIDEDALKYGVETFVQFVLDYQNGIDIETAKESDERTDEK